MGSSTATAVSAGAGAGSAGAGADAGAGAVAPFAPYAVQLVRSLQSALMGAVWCAVECGPPPWYAPTDRLVAVKDLSKVCIASRTTLDGRSVAEDPEQELRVMRYLYFHRNIPQLLQVMGDDTRLYIVMEFIKDGDLFAHLSEHGRLTEVNVRTVFTQLLDAVEHMHSGGLCHLDLSLENVMFASAATLDIRLIDFGTTRTFHTVTGHSLGPGFVGKKQYAAPEILNGETFSGMAVDLWSLGVMLFMLLYGVPPFKFAHRSDRAFAAVRAHGLPRLMTHWGLDGGSSAAAVELVCALLTIDPAARPNMAAVRAHKWFALTL